MRIVVVEDETTTSNDGNHHREHITTTGDKRNCISRDKDEDMNVNNDGLSCTNSINSADEALDEMLGFSLSQFTLIDNDKQHGEKHDDFWRDDDKDDDEARKKKSYSRRSSPSVSPSSSSFPDKTLFIQNLLKESCASKIYQRDGVYMFPKECSLDPILLHRLTELLRLAAPENSSEYKSDKTYETIRGIRTLTRFENFVRKPQPSQTSSSSSSTTTSWYDICHAYIGETLLPHLFDGEPMTLYKEKLNCKPSGGGKGFAPHLDTPSLRVLWGDETEGPQNFVTVMIAIDKMTIQNGCLQVVKGNWSKDNHVPLESFDKEGNPDKEGRAGAVSQEVASRLQFEPIECEAGTILAFDGYVPHCSSTNLSQFQRRAIFLTYNPLREGNWRDYYYDEMTKRRNVFKEQQSQQLTIDHQNDLSAFNTVPK